MRRFLAAIIIVTLLTGLAPPAVATGIQPADASLTETAAYILRMVKEPQVDSVGGEWAVVGLARSGYAVPDSYYANYYKTVETYVKDHGGILHDRKYTEYSRVILGLTAAGYDPRDVAGYDVTAPLGDFERTVWQGVNGPIFALIALDSFGYTIPVNPNARTQATREMYVAEILRLQTSDGGWNLTAGLNDVVNRKEKADADMTGMALQALAKYQSNPEVEAATDRALHCLSALQDDKGGYSSNFSSGSSAVESTVQVLVALCELGIAVNDTRFVKDGNTLIDNILSYRSTDGSFRHTQDGSGNNQMSTEQAFYGLVAAKRIAEGKESMYRMSDTVRRGVFAQVDTVGLPDKHGDVEKMKIVSPGKTFTDIGHHLNLAAIEALAARGVISGKSEKSFDPDTTMTRAEFATIVVRALGLPERASLPFSDVPGSEWYAKTVATAYYYEVVSGRSFTIFDPTGTITRQEAAAMVTRAAKLCGMDTEMSDVAIRDLLAQFTDYRLAHVWARSSLAFCYSMGILDDEVMEIKPSEAVKRCEIAEMLYRMLDKADLL